VRYLNENKFFGYFAKVLNSRIIILVFILSIAIIQLLSHFLLLEKDTEFLIEYLTFDDTYYYLETAWNHKTIGFPTFDGINPTNGFHLLWYLVLYSLTFLTANKIVFLRYVISTCIIFLSIPYIFFYLIARKLRFVLLAVVLSVIWFAAYVSPQNTLLGMENTLHLSVSVWVLYEIISVAVNIRNNNYAHLFRLTIALIVNAMTRVDSGLISVLIYVLIVFLLYRRSISFSVFKCAYGKALLVSLSVAVISAILQFGLYFYWNDTFIPISGIVKMSNIFASSDIGFVPELIRIFSFSLVQLPLSLVTQILICLTVTLYSLFILLRHRTQKHVAVMIAYIILLISNMGYIMYVSIFTNYVRPPWYYSPVNVFWIFSISMLLTEINTNYSSRKTWLRVSIGVLTTVFLVFLVSSGISQYFILLNKTSDYFSMFSVRYRTALWIRDNIEDDVVLASWNAGQLGYFSEHPLINLDGLINSKEYFDTVLCGNESLYQYLRQNNVKYIIDYHDPTIDKFTNRLTVYRAFKVTNSVTDFLYMWDLESIDINSDVGYYREQ